MLEATQRVEAEVGRWSKGVLALGRPAGKKDLAALHRATPAPLPQDYVEILARWNGADLRGDRLLPVDEVLDQLAAFPMLTAQAYRDDPDWVHDSPPGHLIPFAQDLEGNLKCIDPSTTPPEVTDWHRESCELTSWNASVAGWMLTCLGTLAIRFDYRGRPRPIRSRDATRLRRREIEAHLAVEPHNSMARLDLGRWLAENGTPEEALFAFRAAAEGEPVRSINHFRHAHWALTHGRPAEARRALRACLRVPNDPNPRKNSFRSGYLPAAHNLLAVMYDTIGQKRKADEHRRAGQAAAKRYGFDWYAETAEYQHMLALAGRVAT